MPLTYRIAATINRYTRDGIVTPGIRLEKGILGLMQQLFGRVVVPHLQAANVFPATSVLYGMYERHESMIRDALGCSKEVAELICRESKTLDPEVSIFLSATSTASS